MGNLSGEDSVMRVLLISIVALLVTISANAGDFKIGEITVRVGDAEKALRPQLAEKYQLVEIRPGVLEVVDKDDVDVHHGIVQFRDGTMIWASRDAGEFEGEGVRELGKALMDSFATDMYGENAKVSISVDTNPRYEVYTITFEFPGRTVMMYVANKGKLKDVTIEEIILAPVDASVHF
tara:strand:- start:34 stop:570 length:537 start_codon:yes stop_codon:yes gene_type:complete